MVFDLDKTFTLYLKACDMFYACKFDKLDMCNNELIHVLPQLRERLACYVCDKLLEKPFTTPSSKCNHFMCKFYFLIETFAYFLKMCFEK